MQHTSFGDWLCSSGFGGRGWRGSFSCGKTRALGGIAATIAHWFATSHAQGIVLRAVVVRVEELLEPL